MESRSRQQIYDVDEGLQAERTKQRYRIAFSQFLQYCQPCDLPSLLHENPRLIEDRMIGYIRFLHQVKKQNRATINIPVSAVFHFFEMNDVLLNKRKVKRFMPPDESSHDDRPYTYEEIQQILQHCPDERSRMIIMLMASTGMRIGALEGLQLRHIVNFPEYHVYKITVYANSPKERYYTFCTPECAAAIDSYLDYRRRFGDPLKDTAPLIREQFDIYDRFMAAHPQHLQYDGILWILKNVLRRSGMKKDRKEVMRSHGFRKFAIIQMIKARVDYASREYLVGHKHSRGLDVNYDRTSEDDRLAEYLKAIDLLTINSENRLKHKVYQLESQHSDEWNALKVEMSELKALLDHKSPKE